MAKKVITTYVDDLTEEASEEVKTHTVLVDGAGVDIDLSPDSYDRLLEALKPFLHAKGARKVRGSGAASVGSRRRPVTSGGRVNTPTIRAWAKENGHTINDRGRVPAPVREAYEKANA
ncbi:Lsr2 family protein [Streptomyces sp. NPDC088725]|uniref:histone-like nucleoid-structuring protein Lsr2 n=1 Tax=Streptomyces sp. NPDC088725 TaxID=3365873 RepID=UPI003829593A